MTNITVTQRFGRAAAIGVAGLAVALMITVADRHFRADMGFLGCATAGAFLAGLVVARTLGGQGTWGLFTCLVGSAAFVLVSTVLAMRVRAAQPPERPPERPPGQSPGQPPGQAPRTALSA